MEVYILDTNFNKIGYIDEAVSVLWTKKYNDIGECEIYVPCTVDNLELLKEGHYIYREDDNMFCEIVSNELEDTIEDGDYLIVKGRDITNMLSDRIIRYTINYSGTFGGFIDKLLDETIIRPSNQNRWVSNFILITDNFSELNTKINITINMGENLLDVIRTQCKTFNYGFHISYNLDRNRFEFKVLNGKNKADKTGEEYIEFSPTYANIISSNYRTDNSNYKNICYVGYKDANDQSELLSVFNTPDESTDFERREIYVDGSSVKQSMSIDEFEDMFPTSFRDANTYYEDETKTKILGYLINENVQLEYNIYLLLIKAFGLNTLAEHNRTIEFTGEVDVVDTYEYKIDYDLGDIVKIINEYGIEAEARIVEILESDDNDDGYAVEPKFEYIN